MVSTIGEEWQGRVGEQWARWSQTTDMMLQGLGEHGLDALGDVAGRKVLDLGCGAGATTRALAARGADVTGLDLSEPMLEVARKLDPNGRYVQGDAGSIRFDSPFDAIYSRFGVMFFDAPVAALAHLRGQMTPGAEAIFVVWCSVADNPWSTLPVEAVADLLPESDDAPSGGPGPFAWADPAVFEPILADAGWTGIGYRKVESPAILSAGDGPDPVARAIEFLFSIGPLARRLKGSAPELRAAVGERLGRVLVPLVRDDAVQMDARAWIISAQA